ncbi:hypothetical protein SISSUDRAFT_627699 [Sistotremastrum suecicum HHB10207 ss-3]|uniref:Uncharacterized protein n=1 Tax=Sistotremastrum suecicum HHB10207 ss-3 TaxID=1314776 RepID=A0A166EFM2_9AGAM|nr:hypothetical protein SISSUDRAFT_627699 [Sistotremastrum suecicum HHB10207 ss-3]
MTSTVIDALSSSFGIVLLGVLTSSLLHGFTSFQAILYFRTSSDDSWILKWMVLTLMQVAK